MGISSDKLSKSHTRRLLKGNFTRETESLRIVAENNAIKNILYILYHINDKIDRQQNSKYSLCSDGDETIIHILIECRKLVQKEFKSRYVWVEVIHWE